jgi:hypothetical protein
VEMGKRIKLEVQDRRIKNSLIIEASSYAEAKKQIEEFLVYVFRNEEYEKPYTSDFKPEYVPSWLIDYNLQNLSQKDKVYLLLKKNHPSGWVRSRDLQEEYEGIFGEEIKLSSISTYLARFYEHGAVERRGSRAQREYKLIEAEESSV